MPRNVGRAREHFQGASSSDQTRQPCHRPASGHHTGPDFKLRQDGFFAARETHVTGQRKLAPNTRRTPSNRRDRHHRGAAQAHEHIGQRLQTRRPGRQTCRILRFCKKIVMSEKETLNGAVKDHHFDLLVGFERRHDLVQLRNGFQPSSILTTMVSIAMMASSTSNPRARIRAPSEIRSRLMPANCIATSVADSVSGTAAATTMPTRQPRLSSLTTITTTSATKNLI